MILADITEAIIDCEHKTAPTQLVGIPSIRTTDIKNGRLLLHQANRVSAETYTEWTSRLEPKPGDLIIAREAPVGEVGIIPEGQRVCLGQRTVLLRPDKTKVLPRFLLYLLLTPQMRHALTSRAEGSITPHLNMSNIRALPIPGLPDMRHQEAVADLLGALDDKIEVNRSMNETLEAIASAIFKSWFIDFDPARKQGSDFRPSELGEIPSGWRVVQLQETAEIIDCLHSKKPDRQKSGKPLLQLTNIRNDGLLDMKDMFLISEQDYQLWISRMEARKGDCVITNVGRVAAVAQIPANVRAALGRNMTGIRCRSHCPFPTFLIELLMSGPMRDEIVLKTDSGTILESLNVRSIPHLRFVLPPRDMIQKFEANARPLRAKMEANLGQSTTLATLRDTLLPKLISGEIRIRQAEKIVKAHA
jgi:type I restriction enzyme S subunit